MVRDGAMRGADHERRGDAAAEAARLRRILDLADAYVECDAALRIVDLNAAAERELGRERSELVGRGLLEAFPALAGTEVEAAFRRVLAERVPVTVGGYHPPRDLWYAARLFPRDGGGVHAFFRNDTALQRASQDARAAAEEARRHVEALRRTEQVLRSERERFRTLAEALPQLVWTADAQGQVDYLNHRWGSYTGQLPEAARGAGWTEVIHPEDLPSVRERWETAFRGGRTYQAECRIRRRDGEYRWFLVRAYPLREEDGTISRWFGSATDVQDLKRAERDVRDREEWFRTVVETVPHMVWVGGPDGANEYNSQRLLEYTGLTSEQLAGNGWAQTIHPDDLPGAVAYWSEAIASGKAGMRVHRVRGRDGRYRWCRVAAEPLRARDGRVVRWIGTWTDVHEAVEAQEALRESDRRKSEFLAVLSHELRNPLTPIRNALHLLEHAPPGSAEAARAREVLGRQTGHLARLVDDLLDLTRIARGKIALQPATVDLREVLRRSCDDHRATFDARGIALELSVPPAPAWIRGDPTRLEQVAGNLLQNAAKYTARGGHVAVELETPAGRALVRVRDDGIGIAPALLQRLFEPFAQGDAGLARTRGGLGLGLALVKGLVTLHGGEVAARSEGAGQGSTFEIALPLAEAPSARDEAVPERPAPSRSVLVIEDNADAGETLVDVLQLAGHRVALARDGRTGLRLAREQRPDVILCDIGLPDIDGYEVARALRADEALRGVRLIALTGYAQPEDRARAAQAGFDAHLAKPPALERLEALIAG